MGNFDYQYKRNAARILKQQGIVPQGFEPPAPGSIEPDIVILYNNRRAGCDLMLNPLQNYVPIKFDITNKVRPWQLGYVAPNDGERMLMKRIINDQHILGKIHNTWGTIPYKRERDPLWHKTAGKISSRERLEYDRQAFQPIQGSVDLIQFERFMSLYNVRYLNIAQSGLFYMGGVNMLNLPVPKLSESGVSMTYTAQLKMKNYIDYEFIVEFNMSAPFNASPVNLAPADATGDIIEGALAIDIFKPKQEEIDD